jgi:group I intron endonuclease
MSQKFNNGKIYKITNNINSEIYVGSTCDILRKRFNYHKQDRTKKRFTELPLYKLMNELGTDLFRIDLIEDYACDDKQSLRQREGYWIRQIGTLNKVIAGRTRAEYDNDNREKIKEFTKQYYQDNQDKIKEVAKEYRDTHKEQIKEIQKIYRETNKEILNEKKKIFRKTHSEEINQYKSIPITCICGACVTKGNLWSHKKSKKHLSFLENNTQIK